MSNDTGGSIGHFESQAIRTIVREEIEKQEKENTELRDEIADLKQRIASVKKILYCIGGPLNDNKLGYSKEQLSTFFSISETLE